MVDVFGCGSSGRSNRVFDRELSKCEGGAGQSGQIAAERVIYFKTIMFAGFL